MSNREVDLENSSFCVILGMTGHGKSTFINAISDSNNCRVSNKGKSETPKPALIEFKDSNKHIYEILDTPGLGDSKDNEAIINQINGIISHYPYIKKIIIIKPYSELRLSEYLQNALKVMMDSFPLKDFWDHVIIVNNRCVPTDSAYQDFLEENPENFLDKLKNCDNLKNYMKDKGINFPSKIDEFFIDSKRKNQIKKIKDEFEKILENIKNTKMMFKSITKEPRKKEKKPGKAEETIIIMEYIPIVCIDFQEHKTIIKSEYKERVEVKPEYKDQVIKINDEPKEEYIGEDDVEFYDILTLGITWIFRPTSKYRVYDLLTFKYIKSGKTFTEKANERIEYR